MRCAKRSRFAAAGAPRRSDEKKISDVPSGNATGPALADGTPEVGPWAEPSCVGPG